MPTIVLRSLDGVNNWKEARDLCVRTATLPPEARAENEQSSEIVTISPRDLMEIQTLCLDFISNKINEKIEKARKLFKHFLSQSQLIHKSNKFFTAQLRNREVDIRLLPLIVGRIGTSVPDSVREMLAKRDLGIEEIKEGLEFLQELTANLPCSLRNGWNFLRTRRIGELTASIAELNTLGQRVTAATMLLQPVVKDLDAIPEVYETLIDLSTRRVALAEQIDEITRTQEMVNLQRVDKQFTALLREFDTVKKRIEALHEVYPDLFDAPIADLATEMRRDQEHLLTLLCARSTEARAEVYLRRVLKHVTFSSLLNNPTTLIFFRIIAHIYNDDSNQPVEYLLVTALVRKVDAYYAVLRCITQHDYLRICDEDIEILNSLEPEDLQPIREFLKQQTPTFILTQSQNRQKKLLTIFSRIFARCPALRTPSFDRFLQQRAPHLANLQYDVDHKAHEVVINDDIRKMILYRIYQLFIQGRLSEITFNDLMDFKKASPNYLYFQRLLVQCLTDHRDDLLDGNETIQECASFIGQLKAIVTQYHTLWSKELSKLIENTLSYEFLLGKELLKELDGQLFTLKSRENICTACIQKRLALGTLDELKGYEINRLLEDNSLKSAFQQHLTHFLKVMTTQQLRQFRTEQLDPFLNQNQKFADISFIKTFITQTDKRFATAALLLGWIVIWVSDLLRTLFTPFDAGVYRDTVKVAAY